jgi:hypothetical protein
MLKFFAMTTIFGVFCFPAFGHQLGQFPKTRPAVSIEANAKIAVMKVVAPQETKSWREKLPATCPAQYALIQRVFQRIIESNSLLGFVRGEPGVTLLVWCDSPKIDSTYAQMGGVIHLSGAAIGKADSEDEVAFVLAHEVAHLLLAHDEEYAGFLLRTGIQIDRHRQEEVADRTGLELIANAGYDAAATEDLIYHLRVESGECVWGICLESKPNPIWGSSLERIGRIKEEIDMHVYPRRDKTSDEVFRSAQIEWQRLAKRK